MVIDSMRTVRKWCAKNTAPEGRVEKVMAWPVAHSDVAETVRLVREAGWNCPDPKPHNDFDHVIVAFT